jgi:hypothetical protein
MHLKEQHLTGLSLQQTKNLVARKWQRSTDNKMAVQLGGRERELLKSNAPSVQKDMHLKGLYIFPPLQF